MNEILKIIEKRELYIHILLFKLYIENEGRIDRFYGGQIPKEMRQLMGDDFSQADFSNAKEYLMSEGFATTSCRQLTMYGRSYIEDWARNFEQLTESEKTQLEVKLPTKVFDFFKFAEQTKTVLSFINQIIKLKETIV